MNFKFINNFLLILIFIFTISCQERFKNDSNKEDLNNYSQNFTYEKFEIIDFNNYNIAYRNVVDFYTLSPSNINFNEKINKIKINNYEKKLDENHPINYYKVLHQ